MRPGRIAVAAAVGLAGAVTGAFVAERAFARRTKRRTDPVGDPLLVQPDDVTHREVPTSDGGSLHLVERGQGRPLVLLHGITLAASIWSPQLHQLAGTGDRPGFRVIAVDLRGHGTSRAGSDGYGIGVLARDLATVLEALDLRGAIVAGHSMGGMTLMRFCADHPEVLDERVAGLAFVATAATTPVHPFVLARVSGLGVRLIERLDEGRPVPKLIRDESDLSLLICRMAFGKDPSAAAVAQVRSCVEAMDDDALGRSGVGLLDHDVREHLHHVQLPAEIVVGSRDLLTPPAAARRIARLLPHAGFHVLPEAGHQLMQERPDDMARILRSLEQRVEQAERVGLDEPAGVGAESGPA